MRDREDLSETCSILRKDVLTALMHHSQNAMEGISRIQRCKYMQRRLLLQLIALCRVQSFQESLAEMCLISINSVGMFIYCKSAA